MLTAILLILALIIVNGAFALSEIAVVSSRRIRLVRMADGGNAGARRALSLAAEPTRFLSSVQVGMTSIGILSGALGEATVAGHVREMFARVPAIAPHAEPLALAVVVVSITYVSLIVGELAPKRLALTDPERIATIIARPMQLVAAVGRPIVHLLSASTNGVLRLLGVRHVKRAAVTVEEIKVLLEQSAAEGVLEPSEREMMTNVLNLDERHVASVLTPRSEVIYLDVRESADRNRDTLRGEPHDVLPLCDGGLDHVLGLVRTRRILDQVLGGQPLDPRPLAEPPLFVPETMTIMSLLENFKRSGLTAALVVDEFGDVSGIVSLTDVVSAIVGDLPADSRGDPEVVRRDDGSWLLDGAIDMETLIRTLQDTNVASGEEEPHFHTLGGLAMVSLGRVPRTGDTFERGGYRFEIVDMDGNRVDRVLATPLPAKPKPSGSGEFS
jgi:putative hemolysin